MQTSVDISILVSATETFLPGNVLFNEHGVALNGYRWEVWNNGGKLWFDVICKNGLWGGSYYITSSNWGCSGPVTREDCKHLTLEKCVTSMWKFFEHAVTRYNAENERSSINYKTKWFGKAEAEYRHFLALKPEFQLNLFKEIDFYGEE